MIVAPHSIPVVANRARLPIRRDEQIRLSCWSQFLVALDVARFSTVAARESHTVA
jgi:hypothetical protein